MLTDQELDVLGHAFVPAIQRMEHSILVALASRLGALLPYVTGHGPGKVPQADEAYKRALSRESGEYRKTVKKAQRQARREVLKAAPSIAREAAAKAFAGDAKQWAERGGVKLSGGPTAKAVHAAAQEIAKAGYGATKNLVFVLKTGASEPARNAFTREVSRALARVSSGSTSFDQACKDAIRQLSKSGVKTIDYASGRRLNADSAVRLNVQTTAARLSGEITMTNLEKTGVNHVEVSAHTGARTDGSGGSGDHLAWQGKVYQVQGSSAEYPNLEATTGYPGDMTGLYGYNCRHQMYPFWPGISTPAKHTVDTALRPHNGRLYSPTQAAAKQRSMEREIRALKREAYSLDAVGEKTKFAQTALKIKNLEAEYKKFSSDMDIRPKLERLWVDGYNKSVSSKATASVRTGSTVDGIKTQFTEHGIARALERKVSMEGIRDALTKPLAIEPVTYDAEGRPSKVYVGEIVSAAVNPENGNITSTWPTRPSKARRIKKESEGK